jgi:hypothetical protein
MEAILAVLRFFGVADDTDVDGGPFPVDGGPFPVK